MIRWLARHNLFVIAVFNIAVWLLWLPTFLSVAHQVPLGIISGLLILYLSFRLADYFRHLMRRKAAETYHYDCNPHPMEVVAREQLAYVRFVSARIVLQIALSTALNAMGRYDEAKQTLQTINIERPLLSPHTKIGYYNNLAVSCMGMDEFDCVPELLQKEKALLSRSRENEMTRNRMWAHFHLVSARFYTCRKEYGEALFHLDMVDIHAMSLPGAVAENALRARVLVETNRSVEAEPYLEFVLQNGDWLHAAEKSDA